MRPLTLPILALLISSLAGCVVAEETGAPDAAAAPTTFDQLASAEQIDLAYGQIVQLRVGGDTPEEPSLRAQDITLSGACNTDSWLYSHFYGVQPAGGDTVHVMVEPLDFATNVDVDLYVNNNPANVVASSHNPAGYAESVFYKVPALSQSVSIRTTCLTPGGCKYNISFARGDDSTFVTGGHYENQRSFLTTSGTAQGVCSFNGVKKKDGECMCADVSAAVGAASLGKLPMSQVRAAASDLFYYCNNYEGAAVSGKLQDRLKSNFGFSCCNETWVPSSMWTAMKSGLRAGSLVLLRSASFGALAGHYVRVRGFKPATVFVDDPFGNTPAGSYNNTDTGSAVGKDRWYSWSSVTASNASVIVCK